MAGKEDARVFVGGLAWETTDRQLTETFGRFGKVLDAQNRVDEGRTLDAVDEHLKSGASKRSLEAMKSLCSLAIRCLEESTQDRPSMTQVAEEIGYIISIEQAAAIFATKNA